MAKPRIRVTTGGAVRGVVGRSGQILAFDAGRSSRRLKALPTGSQFINQQIRSYGRTAVVRARYLSRNNPEIAAAKRAFVSALVGTGIKPSAILEDADLKKALAEAWLEWTDESDADGLTDFYGQQSQIAGEMFDAGECFVRLRARRPEDGLSVPLQLQILPAEQLPLSDNRDLGGNRTVRAGIEFDAIGRRTAYHFLRTLPGEPTGGFSSETVRVPADQVLHMFKPLEAGQIRGIPYLLAAIVRAAVHDAYDDAELERKRIAALFAAFVTQDAPEGDDGVLQEGLSEAEDAGLADGVAFEPGTISQLRPGEDVKFSAPADVGGNYEAFQRRALLAIATGAGVPYADMTGDLTQASYGSQRAGMVKFRREIEQLQHHVMVFQLCRPVRQRWLDDAVMAGAVPLAPAAYLQNRRVYRKAKWIPPRWEWIDPLKDLQAELLAVQAGFKARSTVIEGMGEDPEEVDARIAQDRAREAALGLDFTESQFAATQITGTPEAPPPAPVRKDPQNGA